MKKKKSLLVRRLWLSSGLVWPVLLAGCACCGESGSSTLHDKLRDKCATIPPGAIPQPIGTHTNELISRQTTKAELDQFVIYLYEWQGDSDKLGPFGSRHAERMAARLAKSTFPVVIEPECDPKINEARRLAFVTFLEKRGITDAKEVVSIAYPQAEGLLGDDAERIYRQMLSNQGYNGNNNNVNRTTTNTNTIGTTGVGGFVR